MAKKNKERQMTDEEREQAREHMLATRRFYLLIVMLFMIAALFIASLVLWIITPRPDKPLSTEGNLFAVETITLEGNTKYLQDSVIGESGVLVGQSIFKIKSNEIEEHLLQTFPYFASVDVQTLHMNEVRISVTETNVIGVMYADGCWLPIGGNGKVLDKQPISSDRPKHQLYIKSKLPDNGVTVGVQALDDYDSAVLKTLLSAINQYNLTDITVIDITDMTDIRLMWRSQIEVWLGNSSNLVHEIGVVAATIPRILESRGAQASGRLNLVSYSSEEAAEKQAVFTPSSLLPTEPTAPRDPAPGETVDDPESTDQEDEESSSDYDDEDIWYEEDSDEEDYYEEDWYEEDSYEDESYEEDWYEEDYYEEDSYEDESYEDEEDASSDFESSADVE